MIFDATLPFPPSLNAAVRHSRGGHFLSHDAKAFRFTAVATLHNAIVRCRHAMITTPCAVQIDLYPPDRRKRDADNRIKAVLDALEIAGVVENDRLCRDVRVISHDDTVVHGGNCIVTVRVL